MGEDLRVGAYLGRGFGCPVESEPMVGGERLVTVHCHFVLDEGTEPFDAYEPEEDSK